MSGGWEAVDGHLQLVFGDGKGSAVDEGVRVNSEYGALVRYGSRAEHEGTSE